MIRCISISGVIDDLLSFSDYFYLGLMKTRSFCLVSGLSMMPSWLLQKQKCYIRNPRLLIKSRRLVILSHFAISIETKRWQPGSGTEEPFARFNLASGIEIDWKQFISPSLDSKLFVRLELQISPSVVYFMLMAVKFDGRERITRSSLLVGWLAVLGKLTDSVMIRLPNKFY